MNIQPYTAHSMRYYGNLLTRYYLYMQVTNTDILLVQVQEQSKCTTMYVNVLTLSSCNQPNIDIHLPNIYLRTKNVLQYQTSINGKQKQIVNTEVLKREMLARQTKIRTYQLGWYNIKTSKKFTVLQTHPNNFHVHN